MLRNGLQSHITMYVIFFTLFRQTIMNTSLCIENYIKFKKKHFNVCPSENNLFYHDRYDAVLQKYRLLITLFS